MSNQKNIKFKDNILNRNVIISAERVLKLLMKNPDENAEAIFYISDGLELLKKPR